MPTWQYKCSAYIFLICSGNIHFNCFHTTGFLKILFNIFKLFIYVILLFVLRVAIDYNNYRSYRYCCVVM